MAATLGQSECSGRSFLQVFRAEHCGQFRVTEVGQPQVAEKSENTVPHASKDVSSWNPPGTAGRKCSDAADGGPRAQQLQSHSPGQ